MEDIMNPLEASDPLSMLIHNTHMDEQPDWSSLSALWPDDCIEPSALSLPALDPDSFDLSADMLAAQFLNESAMLIEPVDMKPRRLSVTSSSSDSTSTGPTFSPLPESPGYTSDSSLDSGAVADPATELAQRVRQLAGVMFAVPTGGVPQSESLPVPTPPPSTPPTSDTPAVQVPPVTNPIIPTSIVNLTNSARPKTSHTTIERRYRTNLNARIQSLRMAVPALRVLEDKDSGKKIKKNLKGGVIIKSSSSPIPTTIAGSPAPSNPYGEVDIIDERGYVDGVKVARKCSKANVLGKAVEYIRVLKRREYRLKNEQEGLKSLICGLVGGPALLREWEKEWRLRFGGEEKDEVGGDLNAPGGGGELDDDDDDDDMDDDDDGEEGSGKKRKRAKLDVKKEPQQKTTPIIQNVVLGVDGQPEKRKRGRPRKVPLPPSPTVTQQQQQPQPQQYLLAVFALFSFFNSPLTANTAHHQHHSHQGHVINPVPLAYSPEIISQFTPPSPSPSAWRDWVQVLHLGVTVLLFVSVVVRMVGGRFRKSKSEAARKNIEEVILGNQSVPALASSIRLYHSTKCSPIMKALFLYTLASSSSGLVSHIVKSWARSIWNTTTTTTTKKELVVLSVGLDRVFDDFMPGVKSEVAKMRSRMDDSDDEEEGGELVIDVLVRHVIEMKSSKVLGKTFVREVIGDDDKKEEVENKEGETGIQGEELKLMSEASKELGGQVEVLVRNVEKVVLGETNGLSGVDDDVLMEWKRIDDNLDEGDDSDSMLSSSTISTSTVTLTSVSSEDGDDDDDGHHSFTPFTILQALVLYRSIFSSKTSNSLVPPKISVEPPTPTTPKPVLRRLNTLNAVQHQRQQVQEAEEEEKRRRQMYALRRLLGSRVFEKRDQRDDGVEEEGEDMVLMEDARDRVVDMLVDAERGRRVNY